MKILILSKSRNFRSSTLNINSINIVGFTDAKQICGHSPDVIIVDKDYPLTEEDKDILNSCIMDGNKQTGQIVEL